MSTKSILFITLLNILITKTTAITYTTSYIQPSANITLTETPINCLSVAYSSTDPVTFRLLLFNVEQATTTSKELSHIYDGLEEGTYELVFINNNKEPITIFYQIQFCDTHIDGTTIIIITIFVFMLCCCTLLCYKYRCDPDCENPIIIHPSQQSHLLTHIKYYQYV